MKAGKKYPFLKTYKKDIKKIFKKEVIPPFIYKHEGIIMIKRPDRVGPTPSTNQQPLGVAETVRRSSKKVNQAAEKRFERLNRTWEATGHSLQGRVEPGATDPNTQKVAKKLV